MRKCPKCDKTFEKSYDYCLNDGSNLLPVLSDDLPTLLVSPKTDVPTARFVSLPEIITKTHRIEDAHPNAPYYHSIEYPQIRFRNSYIQDRINHFFITEFIYGNIIESEEYEAEGERNSTTVETGFEVQFLSNETISILFTETSEFGGVHPVHEFKGYTLDLLSGYRYNYHDLFKKNSDYLTRIPKLICSYLNLEDEAGKSIDRLVESFQIDSILPDLTKRYDLDFYFAEDAVVFINLFDNHVMCACWSFVPFSEILDIIHPEGPIKNILER